MNPPIISATMADPVFPQEVLDMIWENMTYPRLIEVRFKPRPTVFTRCRSHSSHLPTLDLDNLPFYPAPRQPSDAPLPTLFIINLKVQKYALQKLYSPLQSTDVISVPAGTVVNFDKDVIYCPDDLEFFDHKPMARDVTQFGNNLGYTMESYFLDRFSIARLSIEPTIAAKLTRLAVPIGVFDFLSTRDWSAIDVLKILQKFPKMEELLLVDSEYTRKHRRIMGGYWYDHTMGWPRLMDVPGNIQRRENASVISGNVTRVALIRRKLERAAVENEGLRAPKVTFASVWRS